MLEKVVEEALADQSEAFCVFVLRAWLLDEPIVVLFSVDASLSSFSLTSISLATLVNDVRTCTLAA